MLPAHFIVDPSVLKILIPWLKSHEEDIVMGINDFGELKPVFETFFMEKGQQTNTAGGLPRCPTCGKPEDVEIDENGKMHICR